MKKNYEKPDIMFENFALSSSIAAGCEEKNDNQSYGNCAFIYGRGKTVFTSEFPAVCVDIKTDALDMGENDMLCYHMPTERYNVFNS